MHLRKILTDIRFYRRENAKIPEVDFFTGGSLWRSPGLGNDPRGPAAPEAKYAIQKKKVYFMWFFAS